MMRRGGRQHGTSLIELMVSISLGLVVIGASGSLFLGASQNYREDERRAQMTDDAGFALSQLVQELEMAGFWAQVHDPGMVQRHGSLAVAADCGPPAAAWTYADLSPLAVLDNVTAAGAAMAHACLAADEVRPGTDVLAVKRLVGRASGTDADATRLVTGTPYLRTAGLAGLLYLRGTTAFLPVPAPYQDWEYRVALYYIRDFTLTATESPREPSLCRQVLRASAGQPAYVAECLAQGIENLQVEVGVDTDEDGAANRFEVAPDAADLARAVTLRLYLLARSSRPDSDYTDARTYQVGNAPAFEPAGNDAHYYRTTLATEVVLRNPRSLQGLAVQ